MHGSTSGVRRRYASGRRFYARSGGWLRHWGNGDDCSGLRGSPSGYRGGRLPDVLWGESHRGKFQEGTRVPERLPGKYETVA
jgi:hypothetical protein